MPIRLAALLVTLAGLLLGPAAASLADTSPYASPLSCEVFGNEDTLPAGPSGLAVGCQGGDSEGTSTSLVVTGSAQVGTLSAFTVDPFTPGVEPSGNRSADAEYTPPANRRGSDSLSIQATDASGRNVTLTEPITFDTRYGTHAAILALLKSGLQGLHHRQKGKALTYTAPADAFPEQTKVTVAFKRFGKPVGTGTATAVAGQRIRIKPKLRHAVRKLLKTQGVKVRVAISALATRFGSGTAAVDETQLKLKEARYAGRSR